MATTEVTPMAATEVTPMAAGGVTIQAPPTCEALLEDTNQVISYSSSCTVEVDCQASYSCDENYELMGGATVRTCSLPNNGIPVWSGVAPKCELKSKDVYVSCVNKMLLRHDSIRKQQFVLSEVILHCTFLWLSFTTPC